MSKIFYKKKYSIILKIIINELIKIILTRIIYKYIIKKQLRWKKYIESLI